jgi:hypothetical protein
MLSLKRDAVPTGKLEREIADLNARRQTLLAKLSGCEAEHDRAAQRRAEIISDGADDAAITAANMAVAKAIASVGGFQAALQSIDERIAAAKIVARNERDAAERQRFRAWVDGKSAQITAAVQQFQTASVALREALSSTSSAGAQIAAMLGQSVAALEAEIGAITRGLERNRDEVIAGTRDIPDARPRAAPPPDATDNTARVNIYALKPLCWVDPAEGRVRVVARHGIAALPKALAEFVVAKNLGDLSTSARALELMRTFGETLWPPQPSGGN